MFVTFPASQQFMKWVLRAYRNILLWINLAAALGVLELFKLCHKLPKIFDELSKLCHELSKTCLRKLDS